jgi:hypothetical protein
MKKPEKSIEKRRAAAKRGLKRRLRIRKTQSEKAERKEKIRKAKAAHEYKVKAAINKILQSRNVK